MTWDYGFAPADVVTDSAGDVLAGIELRVWDAEVAGKAVAVQQDHGDGWKPASRVLTDDVGRYRFRTEVGPTVWVEDASGRRWRQDAWQTLGTMIDSAQIAVTVSQAASSTADKALDTATGAASAAASAVSSASAAQTAAAASATDAAASAKIAQGAQIAAGIGNSWWRTGSGAPPTSFTTADAPIVGARFRDTASKKTWVATSVATVAGEVTVEWEQTGPLPTIPVVPTVQPNSTTIPAGTAPIIKCDSSVVTTDENGFGHVDFAPAFPNSLVMVVASSGDSNAHDGAIADGNLLSDRWQFRFHTPGHGAGPMRVNWIAVGW
ncbi:Hypothetical protein PFR_JS17-2_2031 [Propionibacterium freudenreichii]|nr:Hypothetical protein PFR_JS17-1_2032 [Propionibacterium freudenreichii]SCQ81238.1 Hypothetical protein PFR_JS17-2_2031 [Propionibacterium freudenreichii]